MSWNIHIEEHCVRITDSTANIIAVIKKDAAWYSPDRFFLLPSWLPCSHRSLFPWLWSPACIVYTMPDRSRLPILNICSPSSVPLARGSEPPRPRPHRLCCCLPSSDQSGQLSDGSPRQPALMHEWEKGCGREITNHQHHQHHRAIQKSRLGAWRNRCGLFLPHEIELSDDRWWCSQELKDKRTRTLKRCDTVGCPPWEPVVCLYSACGAQRGSG